MKIHHIGIIVKDIKKAILTYIKLGYTQISKIYEDDIQHNLLVFLISEENNQRIELIQAKNDYSSVIHAQEGLHHICYYADNMDNFFIWFRNVKIGKIFTKPIPAPALGNHSVVFGMLNTGMLAEFIL